ncbi:hypothetical protein GQ457_17G020160 [Hibiscus cannabinus]
MSGPIEIRQCVFLGNKSLDQFLGHFRLWGKGVEIGKMWEKHIFQISDDFFFYEQVCLRFLHLSCSFYSYTIYNVVQIENCNKPFLEALRKYDDGQDLSDYDFNRDGSSSPHDDLNKRKLAYRHRGVANKYKHWIKERFDTRNIRFCGIGDGWEECEAARAMDWPFIKVDLRPNSSENEDD